MTKLNNMKNRRSFLKTSALGISAAPFISIQESFFNIPDAAVVKQTDECETYYVRENTPITFNISKTTDNITSVSLLSEELIPGSAIPVHKHLNEDEYFFFITGTGIITIDDNEYSFKPGTSAFVPKNTWHGLKNNSNDKVFFSFGYSPAGFEGFFKEIGTPKGQPFTQKPKHEFERIAKKYGMVFK